MNPGNLTDAQWKIFRNRMEQIAEGSTRVREKLNPVAMAEMMLILMDRIDELEKRLSNDAV
jgi:hypothetical protein